MIHERLGGEIGVDGLGGPELVDTCVFDGINDESTAAAFGGFVQLEIVPQRFVDGLEARVDNGSGVVGDDRVKKGPCGRGKNLVVSRFLGRIGG